MSSLLRSAGDAVRASRSRRRAIWLARIEAAPYRSPAGARIDSGECRGECDEMNPTWTDQPRIERLFRVTSGRTERTLPQSYRSRENNVRRTGLHCLRTRRRHQDNHKRPLCTGGGTLALLSRSRLHLLGLAAHVAIRSLPDLRQPESIAKDGANGAEVSEREFAREACYQA